MLEEFRDTLTELNAIGDQVSVTPDGDVDEQIDRTRALQRRLDQLTPKAQAIDMAFEMPGKLVQQPTAPKKMTEHIGELQSALREREANLLQLAHLRSVAPEISNVNDSLETQFDELTQAPVDSLNQQQALLQDLENKKRRLEESLSGLPSGAEADELRQRSQWNLSRLKDWLKKLADAVGDRLAALAAFNAIRDDVDRQVSELRSQIALPDQTSDSDMLKSNMRRFEVDLTLTYIRKSIFHALEQY